MNCSFCKQKKKKGYHVCCTCSVVGEYQETKHVMTHEHDKTLCHTKHGRGQESLSSGFSKGRVGVGLMKWPASTAALASTSSSCAVFWDTFLLRNKIASTWAGVNGQRFSVHQLGSKFAIYRAHSGLHVAMFLFLVNLQLSSLACPFADTLFKDFSRILFPAAAPSDMAVASTSPTNFTTTLAVFQHQ